VRERLLPALPVALAIFVFGTIFGAATAPVIGNAMTVAMSAVIFSGAVQFAVAGLLLAAASPAAMVLTAAMLNLRHLLLGAVMRARTSDSAGRRAVAAWFLVDESVGLALASDDPPATLVVSGALFYVAWVAGTVVGLLGASLEALATASEAVFPVLFVGLAAISARRLHVLLRAAAAAAIAVALASFWPGGRGLIPLVATLAVIFPGRSE
jgi:predicted branched-subunit amino acid permease